MSREWKVLMKKSAGVIEKCLRRIFIYANNEPKSALVRDPGDCRDNKGKPAKCVFSCFICGKKIIASDRTRCRNVHWHWGQE